MSLAIASKTDQDRLPIRTVLLRDASTRALLLRHDIHHGAVRVEGTSHSLLIADPQGIVLDAAVASLELIDSEGIHYTAAGKVRGAGDMRTLKVSLLFTR